MPEHETFDLDSAFARLERDIAGATSPRGAGLAVTTARRRRRTTYGAIAAVAVLAVGGVAIGQGLGHHDSTISPTSSLPKPAPLDAAALTTATQGWTSAWGPTGSQASRVLNGAISRCIDASPALSRIAEPARSSGDLSFTAGDAAAFATLVDLEGKAGQADHRWTALSATVSQCPNATLAGQQVWVGGEANSYALTSASGKTEQVWLACEGTTIGILWIANAPDPVPADDDTAVMNALGAALQWPGTYQDDTSATSTPSQGSTIFISASDLTEAFADWQSGWSATSGGVREADSAPCGTDLSAGAAFGEGEALGANGVQGTYGFESVAEARDTVQADSDALAACTSASYDVSTVTIQGGSVTVATGSGKDADVVWVVESGTRIAYVAIPAGDTAPPVAVTQKVGELLQFDLDASPSGSGGSDTSSLGPVTSEATAATESSSTATPNG